MKTKIDNKKEIKELKDKIAKAISKGKSKKAKKLNKKLKVLLGENKGKINAKTVKPNKHTLIIKEGKKTVKKGLKKEGKKTVKKLEKKEADKKYKILKDNIQKACSTPTNQTPPAKPVYHIGKDTKPKPYPAIVNYGASKTLGEPINHKVGDVIKIIRQPLDENNKKIKISLGLHSIIPAPGNYLNSYMGVFVKDNNNKPAYIHFPYFTTTPLKEDEI